MIRNNTPNLRCAIYTRKSTEDGLEQAFNSLDAQRDAGESYIASQKSEGWVCLPDRYDDGGFTGGNMERPALKRLLADIEAGKVDCIVVYKVDRLSRSLIDFSKIMDVLERHKVSFVSVTQQFNTSTSMGRLMLNVLLSFAQFEREMISERTRDKIAAARRRGKWTGGKPILGYDIFRQPSGSKLVVNEIEAKRVRKIFEKYLEAGSIRATLRWLEKQGWTNKQYQNKDGKTQGGLQFTPCSLSRLLSNIAYIGKVPYKTHVFDGEHAAILNQELFDRVQNLLRSNYHSGGASSNKYSALLKGLVRCKHCGCAMSHHYASKGNRRYRYYVCINAMKRGWDYCPAPSLPAMELEQFVIQEIHTLIKDEVLLHEVVHEAQKKLRAEISGFERSLKNLDQEIHALARQIGELASQGDAADQIEVLQADLRDKEQAKSRLHDQIIRARRRLLDDKTLTGTMKEFEPVWKSLRPTEQERLVHLLVEQIEYDSANDNVSITFNSAALGSAAPEAMAV